MNSIKYLLFAHIIILMAIPNLSGQSNNDWQIPSCAWQRKIGDRPVFREETGKDIAGSFPETRTKKGIPLGGIGAGNFMYNICGSFGPFYLKPGCYEERFLSQGAFHIREQFNANDVKAFTLATEDVLPAWQKINQGDGNYYALFPRGWCTYNMLQSNLALQFFSPVIKDNYVETALPVSIFLFKIKNTGKKPVKVSVMFTFPNAPYTEFNDSADKKKLYSYKEKIRRGLFNKEIIQDNITAIIMGARDKTNPAETEGTEWCIATTGHASWVSSWDGSGDGSDIWNDFTDNGTLSGKALSDKKTMPSGALAVQIDLDSGEEAEIPFILTWYFPQTEFGSGTRWWKKYTEQYPQKPEQSFAIAKDALKNYSIWLQHVEKWTDLIVKNPVYPEWLKQCSLNELYYSTFGGSFWENGCINKTKKFGNRPGQHLASVMECAGYRFFETFDVRHHVSITYRILWPEIEHDILLAYNDFILDSKDGSCPHDAGSPDADPYFEYDDYGRSYNQDPRFGIEGRRTTPWSEFSPKFIQQVYAYYNSTGDSGFIKETWPAVLKTYLYQLTTDSNFDGITEMKSSEYRDNRLFNAVLWTSALECLIKMCDIINDPVFKDEVIVQMNKTRKAIENNFWNDDPGFYKYNEKLDYFMADAMLGQRYLDVTGLPALLDENRMASHYKQSFKHLVLLLSDQDGDGIGDMGVANALTLDEKPGLEASEFSHEYEVWTGISYSFSANLYHWGKTHNDGAMMAGALLGAFGVYRNSWLNEKAAFWFSTPEAWLIDEPSKYRALMYQRARAVWELLNEVYPIR
jgi:non-lysosomal glucosylceramidase